MTKYTETHLRLSHMLKRPLALALIVVGTLFSPAQGQDAASLATAPAQTRQPGGPGTASGPSIEGVTEYRLENGPRVLLAPDASQANPTVNLTYRVGSRHENHGQT